MKFGKEIPQYSLTHAIFACFYCIALVLFEELTLLTANKVSSLKLDWKAESAYVNDVFAPLRYNLTYQTKKLKRFVFNIGESLFRPGIIIT